MKMACWAHKRHFLPFFSRFSWDRAVLRLARRFDFRVNTAMNRGGCAVRLFRIGQEEVNSPACLPDGFRGFFLKWPLERCLGQVRSCDVCRSRA